MFMGLWNIIRKHWIESNKKSPNNHLEEEEDNNTICWLNEMESSPQHLGRKSLFDLGRISCAVMGIEFSYAAETAFVSPILLHLGLKHKEMTLIWIISPILGFCLTPILGSLSDGCNYGGGRFGRRRPFILLFSIGIILGLILIPNGELIGYWLGDDYFEYSINNQTNNNNEHGWGIFVTTIGTVLLDFDADACQSPSRAYMLDITIPEDHTRGLSMFTIMAGLGGTFGYLLGSLHWENIFLGQMFGGHVRVVFTLVLIIFIICVFTTIRSFPEVPINSRRNEGSNYLELTEETCFMDDGGDGIEQNDKKSIGVPSFLEYLMTIRRIPCCIGWICLTNYFSWMSLVCYSLYFTDFVGESVYGGDPSSPIGSSLRELYEDGVRFGCLGMSIYSFSCSIYSFLINTLIKNFGTKKLYFYSHLIYSIGMILMAITSHPIGVICFSWTAGVMYGTLFTIPYILIAKYHHSQIFEIRNGEGIRGIGTDVAIVSSMVFLAQITQSLLLGHLVTIIGSTSVIVWGAACFAACGALVSTKVLYLDI